MNRNLVRIIDATDTIACQVFKILLEVGEFTIERCVDTLTTPYSGRGRWRSVYNTCSRLEKRGYLTSKKVDGKRVYTLREPTRQEILALEKLKLNAAKHRTGKWGGRWWLVTFDIPETRKHHRDNLRWRLKRLGLALFQNSVWLTPYPLTDDFYEIMEEAGLVHYVAIIETTTLPRQKYWLKEFGLASK